MTTPTATPTTTTPTPVRTSKADKNLYSVSRNIVELYAGTDRAVTVATLTPGTIIDGYTIDLKQTYEPWDSSLKVCDETVGLSFINLSAMQGNENVCDCNNRVRSCTFQGNFGDACHTGDQVITTKGGCFGLAYQGIIWSKGRIADVVVGAWSDQCHDSSYNLDYSGLKRADCQPVTFVFGRVNSPLRALIGRPKDIKLPPGAKVLFWKSVGTMVYYWGKFAAVKLGFFGKGVTT